MRTRFNQPPYGPHLPDRILREGWWLDYSQQPSDRNAGSGKMRTDEQFRERENSDRNN